MKKPWSISTTVRTPGRLRGFLRVLKELEGEPFNDGNQIEYQILLIKNKLYKPGNLTIEQKEYFNDIERDMPFSVAQNIFNSQQYTDPAMRGRNSVAPMNKMGLCIARNSAEAVTITSLGEYFLSEDYDLGQLFFSHFLKWQLPNPASRTFLEREGFSIKPFIGTLHLITNVNHKWKELGNEPIGISKEEFSLFGLTLIHHRNIVSQADNLIRYRLGIRSQSDEEKKEKFRDKFKKDLAREFLNTSESSKIEDLLNNLKDYGDNAIRYFRLTRYLYIRGGGFYVDLEPRRITEIKKLLATDNAAPLEFKSANEYMGYLADLDQPTLPWETKSELLKIAETVERDALSYISDMESKAIKIPDFCFQEIKSLNVEQLKNHIEDMRAYRRKLQEQVTHFESQDTSKIKEYICALKNIHRSKNKRSIELEKLATLALNALNDALEVAPNYPVGDDNEPTFTAPANKPDIECFYEKFNSVCEVTMLTDRSQWYNEGQPVMRHVRNFEETYREKTTYCLFVSPRLHQDTAETFWMAVKYGYKGAVQKIVPLSISQLIRLLEILLEIKVQGKIFAHEELLDLYEKILDLTNHVAHSDEWINKIPETITEWCEVVLAR